MRAQAKPVKLPTKRSGTPATKLDDAEVYRLVRALRDAALPRNRHFDVHATREARHARRIHRFLRAVERDLERASEVRASPREDGGLRVELVVAVVRVRRVVELDARALAVLLERAENAARLRAAQPLASAA